MTDQQLYLAIGIPSFAVLMGMLMNGALFLALNSRMQALEARVNEGFQLILGKIAELDNRLSVLEERLKR